ncbi:MAG: DUF2322 family protein [Candidatus Levybacteria bacterium]|nr:DUF2322 family protein [Candidatus Levybacteria bacterium]
MDKKNLLYLKDFEKRISQLNIQSQDIKRLEVTGLGTSLEFPNRPGKQNSLKLFIYLALKNKKTIDKNSAKEGLKIFGQKLRTDAASQRGKHPAIDLLENIAKEKSGSVVVNVVKHEKVETLPPDKIEVFKKINKKFTTPLYVYFESELIKNLKTFLKIPAPFGLIVRYAIKANSNAAILNLFNKMGAHFDASTLNECLRVLSARIAGSKIRLTSQEVQSEKNIKYLTENNIIYTACSLRQLETYGKILPGSDISIRFNVGIGSGWNPQTSTGGKSSSFGIYQQKEEINSLLEKYELTLKTVHLHIGSGSDPEKQKDAIKEGLAIVRQYKTVTNLNMGGGFKVGGMSYENDTNINKMGKEMEEALRKFYKETGRKIILEVEPGTALVAKAGYILTEVIDKVNTGLQGEEFLKINAGMTMNARIPMYGAQHPLVVIPLDNKKREIKEYIVSGVCCESGDVLTVRPGKPEYIDPRRMMEANVGDLLVIGRSGAYCSSMTPANYNSQLFHPEILVRKDGSLDEIRTRQLPSDIWKYERIPNDLKE